MKSRIKYLPRWRGEPVLWPNDREVSGVGRDQGESAEEISGKTHRIQCKYVGLNHKLISLLENNTNDYMGQGIQEWTN